MWAGWFEEQCQSFPRLKLIYKEIWEDIEETYFIGTRKPSQPQQLVMVQEPFSSFNYFFGMYSPQQIPKKMQYLIAPWNPHNPLWYNTLCPDLSSLLLHELAIMRDYSQPNSLLDPNATMAIITSLQCAYEWSSITPPTTCTI